MPDNTLDLPPRVEPAPRGSKTDWKVVSGEVPEDTFNALDKLCREEGKARTDLVCEAVQLLIQSRTAA